LAKIKELETTGRTLSLIFDDIHVMSGLLSLFVEHPKFINLNRAKINYEFENMKEDELFSKWGTMHDEIRAMLFSDKSIYEKAEFLIEHGLEFLCDLS